MKHANRWLAAAAALVLPLAACEDSGITGEQQASLSVYLTDAPGDVEAAWVTVTEVRLVSEGAEDEEQGSDIIVVSDGSWTGDLLELQNEVEALVRNEEIPAGRYTQIRLVISEACLEVATEEGSEIFTSSSAFDACGSTAGAGQLHMPSFGSSGLKINLPASETEMAGDEALLLDFDVAQSFGHQAGNSGRWVMTPVIKATRFEAAAAVNVSVALGTGIPEALTAAGFALTDFGLKLNGEAPVALDANGVASFGYVPSGTHTLTLVGPDGWVVTTTPASPYTFTTTAGATQQLSLTLTGLTAG